MNLTERFKLAFMALKGNLLRTALTMLGITIGIASVIMITSIGQGANQYVTNQVSSLGTNLIVIVPGAQRFGGGQSRIDTLTLDDAKAIADPNNVSNIELTVPVISQSEVIKSEGQSQYLSVSGTTEDYFTMYSFEPDQGQFFTNEDDLGLNRVAVLGSEVANVLFGPESQPLDQNILINDKVFKIIGVAKSKGSSGFFNPDNNVYIPLNTGMKTVFGRSYLTIIFAKVQDTNLIGVTIDEIKQVLLDRHKITDPSQADFTVSSSLEAISTLNSITSILTLMLAGIAGISLLVGGIGIMNIMLVTVTERTREIGLLKAIGAKRREILSQFLIEALILTVIGGMVGMTIGITAAYFLCVKLIKIPFVLKAFSIILAVGISAIVGIIFGIYPARRAASLNPIEALRYE